MRQRGYALISERGNSVSFEMRLPARRAPHIVCTLPRAHAPVGLVCCPDLAMSLRARSCAWKGALGSRRSPIGDLASSQCVGVSAMQFRQGSLAGIADDIGLHTLSYVNIGSYNMNTLMTGMRTVALGFS